MVFTTVIEDEFRILATRVRWHHLQNWFPFFSMLNSFWARYKVTSWIVGPRRPISLRWRPVRTKIIDTSPNFWPARSCSNCSWATRTSDDTFSCSSWSYFSISLRQSNQSRKYFPVRRFSLYANIFFIFGVVHSQRCVHFETRPSRMDQQVQGDRVRIDQGDARRWSGILEHCRKNLTGTFPTSVSALTSPRFSPTVSNVQREERWNEWKNRSCPEIKKPNAVQMDFKETGRRERYLGDTLKEYSNRKKYFMGRLVHLLCSLRYAACFCYLSAWFAANHWLCYGIISRTIWKRVEALIGISRLCWIPTSRMPSSRPILQPWSNLNTSNRAMIQRVEPSEYCTYLWILFVI